MPATDAELTSTERCQEIVTVPGTGILRQKPVIPDNNNKQEALLLDAGNVAKLCGLGKSTWYRLDALGRIPAPIILCRRRLWSRAELEAWVLAGCPTRVEWEKLKKSAGNDLLYGKSNGCMYTRSNMLHQSKNRR
ncbi:MAG: helix-turn-helix transcriptional regulator [Planctomycetota bacterium]|jgi:predicted DNA-binding transcriptional regulator AlpA